MISDDESAPASAVEELLTHYSAARVEHRLIDPQQHNIPTVGHMGFFRERYRDTLWREVREWLESQQVGLRE